MSNLADTVDEKHLEDVFSQFGAVRSVQILSPESSAEASAATTRRAIVDMDDDDEANRARRMLDGENIRDTPVKVEVHLGYD